jgi:hypothetical protein
LETRFKRIGAQTTANTLPAIAQSTRAAPPTHTHYTGASCLIDMGRSKHILGARIVRSRTSQSTSVRTCAPGSLKKRRRRHRPTARQTDVKGQTVNAQLFTLRPHRASKRLTITSIETRFSIQASLVIDEQTLILVDATHVELQSIAPNRANWRSRS